MTFIVCLLACFVACAAAPGVPPDAGACAGLSSISSVSLGHDHEVCVVARDLATPPPFGATYVTSTSSGHAHRLELTTDQLHALAHGKRIAVASSMAIDPGNGETHVHMFVLAAH
jgi:hypothetical protein